MAKDKKKTRAEILSARPVDPPRPDVLSTGCTLLDTAFGGGVPKGCYFHLVGESGAMKSWLTYIMFAEAARDPKFKDHKFVFDNAENGSLMDVRRYFGSRVVERLAEPSKRGPSRTVEEFYFNVEACAGRFPCVYVLDSMDALLPRAEQDNFEAKLHYHETGKGLDKVKGSMGMSKAKDNAGGLCRVANVTLRETGSVLVIISQTRDLVGSQIPGMKTCSGGRTLKFYAHFQAWARVKKRLKKTHRGDDHEYGSLIEFDVTKNRGSGWEGKLPLVSFYTGVGLDDLGSSVDYLLDVRHWKPAADDSGAPKRRAPVDDEEEKAPKRFAAPEFDFVGTREELVQEIESSRRRSDLRAIVERVWAEIQEHVRPKRTNPYTEDDGAADG